MPRGSPRRFLHQPKSQIPIDRCLPAAGSFLQDFRTPSAPETLQESGPAASDANAEWLTLTLIEAALAEATLVGITHRLRRFANVR
jgi:hypothetical protein